MIRESAITQREEIEKLHQQIEEKRFTCTDEAHHVLALSKKLGKVEQITKSQVFIARSYLNRGNTINTRLYLEQAQKTLNTDKNQKHDPVTMLQFHFCYGSLYCYLNQHGKALYHYKQLLVDTKVTRDQEGHRTGLLNLGFVYSELGDWELAIRHLQQAIVHPYESVRMTLAAQSYLADVFEFQEQWEAAYPLRKQVAEQFPASEPHYSAHFHQKFAFTQTRLLLFEEAWLSLESARTLLREAEGVDPLLAQIDVVQGYWHMAQAQHDAAKSYCHQAIQRLQGQVNPQTLCDAQVLQARIYYQQGDFSACCECLCQLDSKDSPVRTRRRIYKYLHEAYAQSNRWQEAYEIQLKLQQITSVEQANLHAIYRLNEETYRHEAAQKLNTSLSKKNSELRQLHDEKDELFRIVAHDLKNPLSAAVMTVQLLIDRAPYFSAEQLQQRHLRIQDSLRATFDIISQLTALAETESNAGEADSEVVRLDELAKHVVTENMVLALGKQQNLVTSNLPSAPVYGNRLWIRQVISNLISNAIKYSHAGATTTVSLEVCQNEEAVCLMVQDEGLGLSVDDLNKMFGKYTKLTALPTGNESSTGLGLYISRTLVEKMSGSILAKSDGLGKGSVFTIKLPTQYRDATETDDV